MLADRIPHPRLDLKRPALQVVLFTCLLILSLPARAVQILNAQNMSNFDKTNTPFTIYGGVAGAAPPTSTGTVYNNCATVTGGLLPCNNSRIYADLRLIINFKSDTGTGKPALYYMGSAGSTTTGQLLTSDSLSPGSASAGSETYVAVPWSEVCRVLSGTDSGIDTNCNYQTGGTVARGTFKVGFQASATDTTMQSDGADIQIAVGGIGDNAQPSIVDGCDITAAAHGICSWEMLAGDSKAILVNPRPISGRTGPTFNFRAIRMFYAPVPVGQEGQPPFDSITPATTTYADLNIDTSASGDISVTPGRVEGLSNYTTYMFKLAMIDLAGNVGFYTASGYTAGSPVNGAGDFYCENSARVDDVTGFKNCHVATPGEVDGALKANSCFIATAAYGSAMAPQTEIFRKFRNHFLLTNRLGSRFVDFYYEHGQKYAQIIAHNEVLRTLARVSLWPILALAWISLQIGAATTFALLFSSLIIGVWMIRSIRRRRPRAI